MQLDFRIDWGYQYLYSRRQYHYTYIWDGSLSCTNGTILESYQLAYPALWWGPGQSARETKLEKPVWKNSTKRGLAGVRFVAEVKEDTEFILDTVSGTFSFKASDILEKGYLSYMVGPKYQGCYVNVIKTGYYWFRPEHEEGKTVFNAKELGLEVHDWARMKIGWLHPGQMVDFSYEVLENGQDYSEVLIHLMAMAVPEFDSEKETQVQDEMQFELFCDGKKVKQFAKYYRPHDRQLQMLEDDWVRVSVSIGVHRFAIKNLHKEVCLGIDQIKVSQHNYMHGQLSIPKWALLGEKLIGKVFAVQEDVIMILSDSSEYRIPCKSGWNEFAVLADQVGKMCFKTNVSEVEIEVLDCKEEENPVKVGYDMTVVPHDENGFMDWLLDYTQRTRLGNYVMFRNVCAEYNGGKPIEKRVLEKWGEYCKNHGIYVAACTNYLDGVLIKGAGDMFHDCGLHEFPGKVYAFDPEEPYASESMKEASEHYMSMLKAEIEKTHTVSACAAFGDASGGIRYSFLAGADFVRAETMVGHTMTLLSQARPAAEALGKGGWGVHIAIQHAYQPYRETHLGQYFLSLMQPWMMGAELVYEEDSLFNLFKEERQTWDDYLTKGKRNMTRKFFRFVKTHPRQGKCVRNIAFLEGRYAAPFNGFICGPEQNPHYSVWGLFGNRAQEWRHGQPEKCRQILDVLMPGASTQPFRQKIDKRRFYFSGTPYGDFDCIPVESDQQYIDHYKLLLNLGWNTMIEEDYEKIKGYVKNGGTLLTGILQFSTHEKRDFLKNMDDLALWNNGDLSELCGIVVESKGDRYSGQWNCRNRQMLEEPELSAMPSDDTDEDGTADLAEVKLCGAEIVAWDAATGKPMLVKKKFGKGTVYTFTLWAYPGHEKFMRFSAVWVTKLAEQSLPENYVKDASKEVFWTRWEADDKTTLMLLNTDWTMRGNEKKVNIIAGNREIPLDIKERTAVIVEISDTKISVIRNEL